MEAKFKFKEKPNSPPPRHDAWKKILFYYEEKKSEKIEPDALYRQFNEQNRELNVSKNDFDWCIKKYL